MFGAPSTGGRLEPLTFSSGDVLPDEVKRNDPYPGCLNHAVRPAIVDNHHQTFSHTRKRFA